MIPFADTGEPPIIWQHVVIACLSPIPGILIGVFMGKRLTRIEIKLNGQMAALKRRLAKLEDAEDDDADRST